MQTNDYINYDELKSYLREIKKFQLVDKDKQRELLEKAKSGDIKSKELLILSNQRFVITVAKKYMHFGLSLSDLISEGNIGLIKSIDRFDLNSEVNFISYAVYWIRYSIINCINNFSRTVRLPSNVINDIVNLSKKDDNSQYHHKYYQTYTSLDRNLTTEKDSDGDDGFSLINVLEQNVFSNPEYTFTDDRVNLSNKLSSILSRLTDLERYVLTKLFGLDNLDSLTITQIAENINRTKENVRQIRNNAIRKIRYYSNELIDII